MHGTDTELADVPGRRRNPSGEMFRSDELTRQPTKAVSEQILSRTRARKQKEEHGRQMKMRRLFSRLTAVLEGTHPMETAASKVVCREAAIECAISIITRHVGNLNGCGEGR